MARDGENVLVPLDSCGSFGTPVALPGEGQTERLVFGDLDRDGFVDAIGAGPGADLRIRYAPTEYGTDLVGRLVVVTDENTWVFEVVGTIPEYEAPRPGARVSTAMDERTRVSLAEAQAPRTSNIVLQNTKPEFYTSRRLLSRTEGATTKKK